jgi:uncharacterized UBP type Zn finger protein
MANSQTIRLWCFYCHRSVSSELPPTTIFRAIAICPECTAEGRDQEAAQHSGRRAGFLFWLIGTLAVGVTVGYNVALFIASH